MIDRDGGSPLVTGWPPRLARLFKSRLLAAHVRNAWRTAGNARGVIFAAVALIILARSSILVFWEQSYFDSNQAVTGLMAKHLTELRAFPVFMYGQNYMLAVEAWLAAPVFLIGGVSVAALKLPLLAMNFAVAFLLLWILERDAGLTPARAGLATLFFVLPSPGTAAQLLEPSGGNLEPFLYVLLIWLTRRRPAWCGLILGIGFLNREFTAYGLVSLLALDAARGSLFTRRDMRRTLIMLRAAAEVWLVVQLAKQYSSALGPGTTLGDLHGRANDLVELSNRFCFDWRTVPGGFLKLVTVHWPLLFGTSVRPLRDFAIESGVTQGMRGAWILLSAAMLVAVARILIRLAGEKRWRREYDFCAYLTLIGVISGAVYVIGRCGVITQFKMRYELLSLLGAVGLAGWYLRTEHSKALRTVWILLVLSWAAVGATAHARLWSEYLRHPPVGGKRLIARHLEARDIRYAISDYWTAYCITFLTNEEIIVASDRVRIRLYQREVEAHRKEAVRITRAPCAGASPVMPGIFFCKP